MSGLDKMISQIEEEAKVSADKILEDAKEQAQAAAGQADRECESIAAQAEKDAAAAYDDILNKSRSAAAMQRKRELLTAKQEVIGEIISKSRDTVLAMDDKAYFKIIAGMLNTYATDGRGEVRFNSRDLARLPEGFAEVAEEAASRKGGSLKISDQTADIDGGFLLIYGGIEENCSFEALFTSEKDNLRDRIHELLFA